MRITTSVDMEGRSVSPLKHDEEIKSLLGYPVDIPLRVF
jgi:dihydroxyacetone kinase